MLNLIIPYRHEREGYFKELEALSSYTNSELRGYIGGCLTAAAALKAHPLSKEIVSPTNVYKRAQGRETQGKYRVKISGSGVSQPAIQFHFPSQF